MLVLVVTVIMDYFLLPVDAEIIANATLAIPNPHPIPNPDFSSMFSSFPIFCFAYQGHMSSVKVYRRIEHPKKYPWITACAFLVTFVLYNTCSVFAVMTYGAAIDPDMLNSYPLTDIPMYCARIGIIGCLMGMYRLCTASLSPYPNASTLLLRRRNYRNPRMPHRKRPVDAIRLLTTGSVSY